MVCRGMLYGDLLDWRIGGTGAGWCIIFIWQRVEHSQQQKVSIGIVVRSYFL